MGMRMGMRIGMRMGMRIGMRMGMRRVTGMIMKQTIVITYAGMNAIVN